MRFNVSDLGVGQGGKSHACQWGFFHDLSALAIGIFFRGHGMREGFLERLSHPLRGPVADVKLFRDVTQGDTVATRGGEIRAPE